MDLAMRASREPSDTIGRFTSSRFQTPLTVVAAVALFGSGLTVLFFCVLIVLSTNRVNLPLVKITMSIQSVNAIALIVTLAMNEVRIRAPILCSTLRYVQYTCYLTSIFMCCAVTVHLWLVITRRRLAKARHIERWYYIVPFTLALALTATLGTIPNSAYGQPDRCARLTVPSRRYLGIRWAFYYSWFVIASAISFYCMVRVLFSTRSLMHATTGAGGESHRPSSTEAYRNQVNARANSKRLLSLACYTVVYPVISFVSHFPTLIQELLSTVLRREMRGLVFGARCVQYSEGLFLSLAFFLYPAVRHSMRDLVNEGVQYWVVDQEEYWRVRSTEKKRRRQSFQSYFADLDSKKSEERIVRDFNSIRGRVYHFIFSLTPEGRLAAS
ncbi:hypothetical protein H4R18_005586 [Coemansia javaensis]|uniref:Uncharacterized protein n=1 Tax=Coemansia javaensis TaxID=2761396 RepID=A0A9W8LEL2_9FUNG|nr:hypothetical protein H4R18_005586 [Coemansia javaensis]